jgi:hypothetical protein
MTSMPTSDRDRSAAAVVQRWLDFQHALPGSRKYPVQQFKAFADAARSYIDMIKGDVLIHRSIATAINGLVDSLSAERKRVPGEVLWEAERLECLLFNGYDPHFKGDEPPGL